MSVRALQLHEDKLSFHVNDLHVDTKLVNGKRVFHFDVRLGAKFDRKQRMVVEAKTMEVALEVLEGFGRSVKDMPAKKYDKFMNKHKETVFRPNINSNDATHSMTFKHVNDYGSGYISSFGNNAQQMLDREILKQINQFARQLQGDILEIDKDEGSSTTFSDSESD